MRTICSWIQRVTIESYAGRFSIQVKPSVPGIVAHLLPGVRRQVKHQHGEEADPHTGDDEVHGVEERLAPHRDVKGDVQVRLITAGVVLLVPHCGHVEDVPLHRHVELRQVDTHLHDWSARVLVDVAKVNLQ